MKTAAVLICLCTLAVAGQAGSAPLLPDAVLGRALQQVSGVGVVVMGTSQPMYNFDRLIDAASNVRREEEIKRGIQEYQDYAKDAAKLKAAANTTLGAAPEAWAQRRRTGLGNKDSPGYVYRRSGRGQIDGTPYQRASGEGNRGELL